MRGDVQQLMLGLVDHVGDGFLDRLRSLAEPLQTALAERSISEPSAERRRLLLALKDKVAAGWENLALVVDESFRRHAAIRAGWQAADDRDLAQGPSSLTLLGDEQVEWDLALAGALSRMKSAAGAALSEFEQRLAGVLASPRNGEEVVIPVGVDVAGIALKRGFEQLVVDSAEQRALLIYVEPLLSREMESLFSEANAYLTAQGVEIPRLRPVPASARPAAGKGGTPGGAGRDSGSAAAAGDVLGVLQRLVQTSGGGFGGGGPGAAGAAPVALPPQMFESLERLQALDLQGLQAGASAPPGDAVRGGNVLRELRQQDFARQLPPIEAATIDIVAMLFDFIFDDKMVPDTVKALVGRLQIPLLKVAMLDKSFFANREHPARALLDTISRVSVASGKGLDHGHPVFERIKSAVNQVLAGFEKDQGIFASLLTDMQALLAEQENLANQLAEKSKGVAERQEQGDIADSKADEAFQRVLKENLGDGIPEGIRDFLAQHWTTVLRFAFLKGGFGGHPWSLAIQTLTDLLWSLTPKSGSDERQRLITMLPELLRRVHAYLDRVGVKPDDKAAFIDALVEIHSGAIKGVRRAAAATVGGKSADGAAAGPAPVAGRPQSASVSSKDLGPSVVVTRVVQEDGIEVESMALAGKIQAVRPLRLWETGNLERGDWVEFTQEDGSSVRGRLSWVSPQRGIMLFTNPQSARAISISPEALALQMRRGLAVKLVEAAEPLVERALGKTMDSLQAA